jgi:hypothetical protein
MQYPNVGAPSPQEIYEGLKMIPNNAQGKQMLTQLAQQGKQTGSIEGGIATAILNSYNKAQPTPPPPQGQVVDQVLAQAQPQPMFDPNAMGIAAPGLEQMAQQNAQQMATGGLVALAQGGPVREFGIGGLTDAWMGGMPDVPEAPDTTQYENDYFSAPEAHPAEMLSTVTSRNVGKGESDKPSFEERVNKLGELYGDMPDVAAQLISEHEHRQAQRSKFNMFENIASGLAGYLGSYGSGEHRAGAGLASMMATMGEHRRAEDEGQTALDALRVKSAMQPYEIRKDLIHQVQSAQTAHDKAQAEATLKAYELDQQRKTEMMKQQFGLTKEEMQNAASKEVANIHANAQVRAAMERINREGLTGGNRTSLYNSILDMAANGEIDPNEVETYYNEAIRRVGPTGGAGAPAQTSSPAGQQVQLGGGKTGWLR